MRKVGNFMKLNKKLLEVKSLSELKVLLRAKQWQKALEGDVKMLIFLGINLLGQTNKTDVIITKKKKDVLVIVDGEDDNSNDPNIRIVH